MQRLAVVGAGLCGVAFFMHLARQLRGRQGMGLELIIINRQNSFAKGVAYGTHSAAHLLNVPAGRMSLLPEEPSDFLAYLSEQGLPSDPVAFVPRSHFGNYLKHRFEEAKKSLPQGVVMSHVAQEAVDAQLGPRGVAHLQLSDGTTVDVDAMVLASGNFLPIWPKPWRDHIDQDSGRFITDPWSWMPTGAMPPSWRNVLVLGTGLTMLDLVMDLTAKGFDGRITAMSRHGLLPQPHRGHAVAHHKTAWSEVQGKTPLQLLRLLRAYEHAHPGSDWRDGVASIRDITPQIWQMWSPRNQLQFLTHLKAFWEVHRHRCAPFIHHQVQSHMDAGALTVMKARVHYVVCTPSGVTVQVDQGNGAALVTLGPFDAVFNCTGPSVGLSENAHPLLKNLAQKGVLRADPLKLGLEVSSDYRVGEQPNIYYIGPMLRACYWEATAVPELRQHAKSLAELVACKICSVDVV